MQTALLAKLTLGGGQRTLNLVILANLFPVTELHIV